MSKRQSLLFIGIFTIIIPYLGIPSLWRTFLTVLVGAGLIIISYYMGRDGDVHGFSEKKSPSTFVESNSDSSETNH